MNEPLVLEQLRWERRDLALRSPLNTSAGRIEARTVVLLEARVRTDGETTRGFGEVAPLPSRSGETVEACVDLLSRFDAGVELDSPSTIDAGLPDVCELPALRFGVELAVLDALARRRDLPLRDLLGNGKLGAVPVQHTQGVGSVERTVNRARDAVERGFSCIKLKVGAASLEGDLARVRSVRRACPDATLRLDANGAWSFDEATAAVDELSGFDIDLIEQPTAADDIDALEELAERSPIDIAPDEACAPLDRTRRLIERAIVSAVVLKPVALGGLLPTVELIELARQNGVRVILSSLIETAIGRSAIAHLAAAHPQLSGPHGLATGPWFADDVAAEPDRIDGGRLALRPGAGAGVEPTLEQPRGGRR